MICILEGSQRVKQYISDFTKTVKKVDSHHFFFTSVDTTLNLVFLQNKNVDYE